MGDEQTDEFHQATSKSASELKQNFDDALEVLGIDHDYESCGKRDCEVCGAIDCPKGEPMHYHHDGCPTCDLEADNSIDSVQSANDKLVGIYVSLMEEAVEQLSVGRFVIAGQKLGIAQGMAGVLFTHAPTKTQREGWRPCFEWSAECSKVASALMLSIEDDATFRMEMHGALAQQMLDIAVRLECEPKAAVCHALEFFDLVLRVSNEGKSVTFQGDGNTPPVMECLVHEHTIDEIEAETTND